MSGGVKLGTLVDFQGFRQHIITDEGEHYYLTPGYDAAPGAKLGDRIHLEYHSTPRLGLWYGKVVA